MRQRVAIATTLLLSALVVTAARAAYDARPPLAHTGGFGEPSCRACHFDGPARPPETLSLGWLTAEHYRPGGAYRLEVAIHDTTAHVGGFQLAVRVATGPNAGAQAGTLCPVDTRVVVTSDTTTGVQYASHAGAAPADSMRWQLEWRAPVEDVPAVVFHLAGNSANDDDSMLGDAIVTRSWEIPMSTTGARSQESGVRGCQSMTDGKGGGSS